MRQVEIVPVDSVKSKADNISFLHTKRSKKSKKKPRTLKVCQEKKPLVGSVNESDETEEFQLVEIVSGMDEYEMPEVDEVVEGDMNVVTMRVASVHDLYSLNEYYSHVDPGSTENKQRDLALLSAKRELGLGDTLRNPPIKGGDCEILKKMLLY